MPVHAQAMRDDTRPDQSTTDTSYGADLIGSRPGEGDAADDDHAPVERGQTQPRPTPSAEDFPTEWVMCEPVHVAVEQQPTR